MNKDTNQGAKSCYKLRNWAEYNKGLGNRGRIDLWISEDVLKIWGSIDIEKKVVGERQYPDCIIQCCLIIGIQY